MRWSFLVVFAATASCMAPRAPIDLHEVDTHVVRFGFAAPRGGVCPGEPLDVDLVLGVDDHGSSRRLFRYRRDLDDAIFDIRQIHLASPQGRFDADGRFYPNADPIASVQSGFTFFVDVPRGPTFSVRYPPVYECATPFGREGRTGIEGDRGEDALIEDQTARAGHDPAMGFSGQEGGAAGIGPNFTVYVTWVKTPDYPKLLAAIAEGDVDGVALRAPGNALRILARGGPGGIGGRGGTGAAGFEKNIVYGKRGRIVRVDYAQAGPGGGGGTGGAGGHGGSVHVVTDERFADLTAWLAVDAGGGDGGHGGPGGTGGFTSANPGARETSAPRGIPGSAGREGPRGEAGSVTFSQGSVREKFASIGAIVPLD